MNRQTAERFKNCAIAAFLFLLAFIPRFIGLGKIVVADEKLWIGRSVIFYKSLVNFDLIGTAQTSHPGVITMWLSGLSMGLKHLMDGKSSIGDLLFAGQFPIALVTSVSVVIMYIIIKRAFDKWIALVAAILIATDPFFLAFSRIIHLDALTACFMTLAVISFIVFLNENNNKFLILSCIFSGLAVLTKIPAVFLYGFIGLIIITQVILETVRDNVKVRDSVPKYLRIFFIWLLVTSIVIFILWPAMWSDPMILIKPFLKGPGMVAHERGQYFMQQPVRDPGVLYYFAVILFRTTPITLVFSLLAGLILLISGFSKGFDRDNFNLLILILYVLLFTCAMSIPAKKIGRYILPVFPMISVLASIGIVRLSSGIMERFSKTERFKKYVFSVVAVIISAVQIFPVIKLHPYASAYYNPIAGGGSKAKDVLLIGRGEGLDLVGKYLNKKENAQDLTVASEYHYLLKVYFKGKVKTLHIEQYESGTLDTVDYLVLYISGIQKENLRIPQEALDYHRTHSPEHVVVINGIEYAYIYRVNNDKTS
jgi:hypothetical protein